MCCPARPTTTRCSLNSLNKYHNPDKDGYGPPGLVAGSLRRVPAWLHLCVFSTTPFSYDFPFAALGRFFFSTLLGQKPPEHQSDRETRKSPRRTGRSGDGPNAQQPRSNHGGFFEPHVDLQKGLHLSVGLWPATWSPNGHWAASSGELSVQHTTLPRQHTR